MKMERKFNTLSLEEYFYFIDNHKSYKDFNMLGLYRSIIENEKLNIEDKISIRDYANKYFAKSFDFLQIKDPETYISVNTIGQELTRGDVISWWDIIRKNQQSILEKKGIKDRNFGVYSKHYCGHEDCIYNGIMIKRGSELCEWKMFFNGDKNRWALKVKSDRNKSIRKKQKQIIDTELNDE